MKFVIIGGDAAGMSAASRAKRQQPEMQVTVLEKTQDVSYSACGMPYNLADAGRSMDELVVRSAQAFREKQNIELFTGHEAKTLDAAKRQVTAVDASGQEHAFAYDRLLIATGGRPIVPDLPGMHLDGVLVLKSLEDGRRIKQYLAQQQVRHAVILGMGYIAMEMCEALHALGVAVEMVKPRPVLLPWLEPQLAEIVRQELMRHDVGVHDGCPVQHISKAPDGRLQVICADRQITTDMVLVAIGITPNSELAEGAGLELSVGRSIAVDRRLQTSDPHVYAAGDCADAYHVVTQAKTWIPLALRANRSGWAVADHVCGGSVRLEGVAGTGVFRVFDLEVARTGLNPEEARQAGFEPVHITIKTRSRAHAHPGASDIHVSMVGDRGSGLLLGVQMVGREGVAHRINAAAVALHVRLRVAGFSQMDLAYAPPFGPTWDPLLVAANQLQKKMP